MPLEFDMDLARRFVAADIPVLDRPVVFAVKRADDLLQAEDLAGLQALLARPLPRRMDPPGRRGAGHGPQDRERNARGRAGQGSGRARDDRRGGGRGGKGGGKPGGKGGGKGGRGGGKRR